MDVCLTCEVFGRIDSLAQGFARSAFETLAPATSTAFNSFVGVWVAYVLVFRAIARGDFELSAFLQKAAVFVLCGTVLANVDLFWEWIYVPAYQSMSGITVSLVSGSNVIEGATDITSLLRAVESEVMRALRLSRVVYEDGGIRNIGAIFYGLLLALPYVFVWGIFLAFTLEGIFKLLAITAVSPLLIAVAGFGPTRGFALTGLRVIVGGVLTVVFAGVAMGFTMTVLRQALDGAPLATGGIKPDISGFLGSEQYWLVLLIGFISILFHLKAATLAANISGASDGPGAAATVVGAGMAAVGAAKALTLKSAQKLGRKGSEAFGAGARAARDRIMGGGKTPAAIQGGD